MKITNKEIARQLGISVTAVSLAIHNHKGVSEETRARVMQLIQEHSDNRDTKQPPAPGPDRLLLLSIHKVHGKIINDKPFFTNMIESIQQKAMQNSCLLSLANYIPGQDIGKYLEYIQSLHPMGIIVVATEMTREDARLYQKLPIPIVYMDASFDLLDEDSVILDNQSGIFRAFDYAYQMGHRDIGYLQSDTEIPNFVHRLDGFYKGLREYGLMENLHPVIQLPCDVEGAYREMKRFLTELNNHCQLPTIFLSDLDYIAIGAIQAFKECGYRIPEDISIIGYDDMPMCEVIEPPLTSIHVNTTDIGKLAAKRLLQKIKNPDDYHLTTLISSRLVKRASVLDRNITLSQT